MHDTSDLTCARQRTERIALLNDAARQGRDRTARIVMTSGLLAEFGGDTARHHADAASGLLRHRTGIRVRGSGQSSDDTARHHADAASGLLMSSGADMSVRRGASAQLRVGR